MDVIVTCTNKNGGKLHCHHAETTSWSSEKLRNIVTHRGKLRWKGHVHPDNGGSWSRADKMPSELSCQLKGVICWRLACGLFALTSKETVAGRRASLHEHDPTGLRRRAGGGGPKVKIECIQGAFLQALGVNHMVQGANGKCPHWKRFRRQVTEDV
jgi:hypothetical protein